LCHACSSQVEVDANIYFCAPEACVEEELQSMQLKEDKRVERKYKRDLAGLVEDIGFVVIWGLP
jgi:hypothetical protein